MSGLDDVYDALSQSIHDGVIDLHGAASRAPLQGLVPILERFRITVAYDVADARLSRAPASVTLTGSSAFGVPGAQPGNVVAVGVRLVCQPVADGTVVFDLALAVTGTWTFDKTFPTLPPYEGYATESAPGLTWRTSFFQGLPLGSPVFRGRSEDEHLLLSGSLSPAGALEHYADLVAPWPLRLDGTVVLPAGPGDPPELDLRAVVSGGDLNLGPVHLRAPGFRLLSVPGIDPALYGASAYSELDLAGTILLGTETGVHAEISGPLTVSRTTRRLDVDVEPGDVTLARGLSAITQLFGVKADALELPPGIGVLGDVYLSNVTLWVDLSPTGVPPIVLPSLSAVSVTVMLPDGERAWSPPVPMISVKEVGTSWMLTWITVDGRSEPVLAGSVFGSFVIDPGSPTTEPPTIDVVATVPDFVITGALRPNTTIPIGAAFRHFLGSSGPPTRQDMEITALKVLADLQEQTFAAEATLTMDWPLPFFDAIVLTGLSFEVEATQATISGAIAGFLAIGDSSPRPMLAVRATKPAETSSGWTFSGALQPGPPLDVVALAEHVLGSADTSLTLVIDRLEGTVSIGDESWQLNGTWSFAGSVSTTWTPEILGTAVTLRAGVSLALAKRTQTLPASGSLTARFAVNRLSLELSRDIGVADPSYAIRIQFAALWAQASVGWTGEGTDRHQVLTVQLGGVTLGDVLEELVNLAAPTLGFTLDPPWDVLKRIDLSSFVLTVDMREPRTIALTYKVEADLVVMYLDSVTVTYTKRDTNAVKLSLTGRFLGQPLQKPLAWDVVNDPPPALPGKGPALVELRYAGVGQHIGFPPNSDVTTVREGVDLLRELMKQPDDPKTNPLAQSAMRFAAGSEWLIGLDLTVMDTVDLAVLFYDPRLYGLSVGLRGDRAGPLAGLRFEVLYKKVTADIGVFRVELQLPDAFRHIELGAVSVTLGVIVVEVYTNGNFRIDLGFPRDRDYSRAFTVQVFPFIGRGGIYFGALNGATSSRVPQISGGTFAPVLELGVGVAVGVGKEISVGPLSGGAYVEVEAIFEGVLAWYNPARAGAPSALYYRAQAIAAIHGKVYGKVDFKVVKASATIEASAEVSVVFEAYRATHFAFAARVDVEAEVEVLWVAVSFSFEAELDLGVTVGSDQPAPWTLAPAAPAAALPPPGRRVRRLTAVQVEQAEPEFRWEATTNVFGGAKRDVALTLLPAFTIDQPPLSWDGTPPPNDNPLYRVAFLLFAANGVSAAAATAAHARVRATDAGDGPLPAALLVEALLRWCFSAIHGSSEAGELTAGELDALAQELDRPTVADDVFTREHLDTFLGVNLNVAITGETSAAKRGAMLVAMPPYLVISNTPGGSSNLETDTLIGPLYQWGASDYMSTFFPLRQDDGGPPPDDPVGYQSFASAMFRDWCLLVAKTAVREARRALAKTSVPAPAVSLDAFAAGLPRDTVSYTVRPGDTVESVAAFLGEGVAELEGLNPDLAQRLAEAVPGSTLSLVVGLVGASIALANVDAKLAAGRPVVLKGVRTQVREADRTLDSLAQRLYGRSGQTATLVADAALASDRQLLRAGAIVQVPQLSSPVAAATNPAVDVVTLTAAVMYVRLFGDTDAPDAEWYAQAVAGVNQATLSEFEPDEPLPGDRALTVPAAARSTTTQPYRTVAGDTLLRMGAALSLMHAPDGYSDTKWQDFRKAVRSQQGTVVVPATGAEIQPGETLELLAWRLVVPAGQVSALLPWVQGADLLVPLAVIAPATLTVTPTGASTLRQLASDHDLTLARLCAQAGITAIPGLFVAGAPIEVPALPAQTVDALVAAAVSAAGLAAISAQVSRQMLAGLRLPKPELQGGHVQATGDLTALAQLSGQQLAAPVPGTDPSATGLRTDVTKSASAPAWFTLGDGTGVSFSFTNGDLEAQYPATGLGVNPEPPTPAALPLAGRAPRTYGLDHRIELQSAVAVAVPGTGTALGSASLWPFPPALAARARAAGATAFALVRAGAEASPAGEHVPLLDATFGTIVDLVVRRVPGYTRVYELAGAQGAADQALLLALSQYIATARDGAQTKSYLAVAASPDAGNPTGLTVLALDPAATFAIRANVASAVPTAAPPSLLHAGLGELGAFVALLWEASVSSGGFFLRVASVDGEDLPPGIFDDQGIATLRLLAIPGEQLDPPTPGRPLLAVDNCALVAPGLDASAHALYVEAAYPITDPSELVTQSVVPAGSVGMLLRLPRAFPPAKGAPLDAAAEARLKVLYSMLRYSLTGTYQSGSAPPVTPDADDGKGLEPWERARLERLARLRGESTARTESAAFWRYDQVVPVAGFGPASVAPSVPGLPPPATDPYRGFGPAALQQATFELGFGDLLGNSTAAGGARQLQVAVGYTDPLLPVAAWPGTTTAFGFTRDANGVTVSVSIAAQPGVAIPPPAGPARAAADAAEQQARKYAQIWFQVVQPTLSVDLTTTLVQLNGRPAPLEVREGTLPLQRYAAAGHLYARAAAALAPVTAAAGATLGQVLDDYGLLPDIVARANAGRPLASLFVPGQEMQATASVAVREGQTAAEIFDAATSGPRPSSPAALLERNAGVLLRPGTVLRLPSRVTIDLGPDAPTLKLADVAASHQTTAAQLAIDGAHAPILDPGLEIHFGEHVVTVGDEVKTPADVQAMFASVGVDVSLADLGAELAERTGVLAPSASLPLGHLVAGEKDTLTTMARPVSLSALAADNVNTPNLFGAGAPLVLGDWSPKPTVPTTQETLEQVSHRYETTPGVLFAQNQALLLEDTGDFEMPGIAKLPVGAVAGPVPYTVMDRDTLNLIAAQFAVGATDVVVENEEMPATLAPGKTVTVDPGTGPVSTPTQEGDSFHAVYARLHAQSSQVTLAMVATAIAPAEGVLAEGALLALPLPALRRKSGAGGDMTAADVTGAYGIDGPAFAAANAALVGVLAPGVELAATLADGTRVTQTTAARDTLNAVLLRLASDGASISLEQLLAANPQAAIFKAGAQVLLPPTPVTLTASIGAVDGALAEPLLPLVTTIRLQRAAAAIHPEFKTTAGDGPVERGDTVVPAPARADDGAATRTFDAFIDACLEALPRLRLATGRVPGEDADLWAVDFGTEGISAVDVEGTVQYPDGDTDARFLALRPLYRDLVNVTAPIQDVTDAGGLGPVVNRELQGIDVEVWARRFLADLDLYLSAPYASGMYPVPNARTALDSLLRAKWTLARAISAGLAPVLVPTSDPNTAAGVAAARTEVERQCGASLALAYAVSAVVQYDTAVTSPFGSGGLRPARLWGGARNTDPGSAVDDFTLGNAATLLDDARSFANFVLTLPDPSHHGDVAASLDYVFDSVEFDIAAVSGGEGYEESSTLSFVRPLAGDYRPSNVTTVLGDTDVPIPLRTQPALPVLRQQTAEPTFAAHGTPTLVEAAKWTFAVTYAHEHAAQDEVHLTAEFNLSATVGADGGTPALAGALGAYAAVADRLGGLMAWYVTPPPNVDATRIATVLDNAGTSLATLVDAVTDAWKTRWPAPDETSASAAGHGDAVPERRSAAVPEASFGYGLRVLYEHDPEGGVLIAGLVVTPDQAAVGPDDEWPAVAYCAADGSVVDFAPGPVGAGNRVYAPAQPVAAEGWPAFRLVWRGLNLAKWQNARAKLLVRRNPVLRPGVATSQAFVATTPEVEAPNVAVPLNVWTEELALTGATLSDALGNAFHDLFGTITGLPLTIGISYRYALVEPDPAIPGSGLHSFLPVELYPDHVLADDTARIVGGEAEGWHARESPVDEGGEWSFSLAVRSGADSIGGLRPLLILEDLVFPLAAAAAHVGSRTAAGGSPPSRGAAERSLEAIRSVLGWR